LLAYLAKIFFTGLVVVAVVELAKRSSFLGPLLASLPFTSLLAFVWLYVETGSSSAVARLASSIFWLILASLPLFLLLPLLLRTGWSFWWSLCASCAATVVSYLVITLLLAARS
jgi:hypothetical protein